MIIIMHQPVLAIFTHAHAESESSSGGLGVGGVALARGPAAHGDPQARVLDELAGGGPAQARPGRPVRRRAAAARVRSRVGRRRGRGCRCFLEATRRRGAVVVRGGSGGREVELAGGRGLMRGIVVAAAGRRLALYWPPRRWFLLKIRGVTRGTHLGMLHRVLAYFCMLMLMVKDQYIVAAALVRCSAEF